MKFAQPYWLLAGLAACLFLLWRYRRFNRNQQAALAQFVSPRLFDKLTATVSASRRNLKQALFIAGVACLCVALARPQAGYRWEEAHRKGVELLVAMDTSKSMLTEDVKPNRLGRAKLAVNDLVDKLNGDGIGLLAFAGDAFLQCPITLDYDAFRESVNALDTSVISRGGTDIGGAIREAQADFNARPGKEKILVLITDGEDLGGEAVSAAQAAAKDGVRIYTVGVGTAAGDLVPVPEENGGTDFVKDPSGQIVKSRLDEATLKQIATVTGGMYEPLGQEGQGLTAIYEQGLAQFTRHDLDSRLTKVYLEQFQWPLLAALLCFVSEMLIGTRRRGTRNVPANNEIGASTKWSPARATAAAAFILFALPAVSHASPGSAEKAYQKGNFTQAEKDYAATLATQPKKVELQFNLGAAAYKTGDYAKAATAFQDTLHTTEVPVQQRAYYNLGDAQYRVGEKTEKSHPQDTIKTWEQAVQSYESALQLKPDDADATFNRDLVKKKLEQLKKQQQQQKQKQDQNKQDQKNQQQGQQNQPQPKDGSKGQEKKPSQAGQQSDQKGQPQQPKPDQGKDSGKPDQTQAGQPQSPKPQDQKSGAANDGQSKDQQEQAAESARGEPGQMTKEEAKQLLDSLKGGEQKLPPTQFARGPVKPEDNQPMKDW